MSSNSIESPQPNLTQEQATECQNWLIHDDGSKEAYYPPEPELLAEPYRLYRFLTDLEDILAEVDDDSERIRAIAPLVRQLLTSSYWLQMEYLEPSPKTGWSVKRLYQEPDYPLTIQTVAWLPGNTSTIHNHATWGIVALISGQEKNRFWRRSPTVEFLDRLELIGEHILEPGDIIGFMPEAIHSVEPMGNEPTITFNLYGATDYKRRFQFDIINHTSKNF